MYLVRFPRLGPHSLSFFPCLSSLLPPSLPVFLPAFFFFSPLLSQMPCLEGSYAHCYSTRAVHNGLSELESKQSSFIVCGWYSSYVFLIYKSLLSLSPLQSIFEEIALFTWSNFPKVFI